MNSITLIGGPCDGREIVIPDSMADINWINVPLWTTDGSSVYGAQYDAHTGEWNQNLKETPQVRDCPRPGEQRTPDYDICPECGSSW